MTPEQIALIAKAFGIASYNWIDHPVGFPHPWNPETNAADCEELIVKLNKFGFYVERWDCPEGRDCSATIVDRLGEELICCDAATTREAMAAAALWLVENGKVGK